MNNEQNLDALQFLPRHTEYIRNMSTRTGKSYRELEAEWKKAEREFEFDRMRDPLKYSNLKKTTGSTAQEISRRFEENVVNPELSVDEQADAIETDMTENEFGDDIVAGIEDEINVPEMSEDEFVDEEFIDDEPASGDELNNLLDDIVGEDSIDIDFDEETDTEELIEGTPNKSLEQQRELERSEETATSAEEVNEQS